MAHKIEGKKNTEVTQVQRDYIEMLKNNCDGIGRAVGFTKLTKLHHGWIFKMLTAQGTWVLQAHRGSYKCFAPETGVLMYDGTTKQIKDIKVGDVVMGWDSTPRKVLNTHSGVDEMYRVHLFDNNFKPYTYDCNSKHTLSMVHKDTQNLNSESFLDIDIDKYLNNSAFNFLNDKYRQIAYKDGKYVQLVQDFEELGKGKFVGIEIEGDGRFRLDNGVVVHNSSCLAIAMALIIVLYPNKSIIFMRKTDEDVKEIVSKVSKILKTPVFTRLSQVFYGREFKFVKDSAFEITTNLKQDISGGKGQFFAMGSSGSLTSKHADIVIVDDICTLKDRVSRVERERIKDIWRELSTNIKNPNGRIISIGTPWHPDDVFTLMPDAEKYTCYETGLLSDEQLQEIKDNTTPTLFAANYELKHIADGERMFSEPKYTKDFEKIYDGICHVDAGYGGGDYTAFGILKKIDERHYIAFGKRWHKHVDLCMNEIVKLIAKYRAGTLYLETNGDKGYLLKEFQKRQVRCSGYHEHTNKHTKISTNLYNIWKYIEFIQETDDDYVGEILDYSEQADFDDCSDNLASLARQLNRGHVKAISGLKI